MTSSDEGTSITSWGQPYAFFGLRGGEFALAADTEAKSPIAAICRQFLRARAGWPDC